MMCGRGEGEIRYDFHHQNAKFWHLKGRRASTWLWDSTTWCQTAKCAAAKNFWYERSVESLIFDLKSQTSIFTFILPWRQFAGRPTHVDKGVEVSLQTLICLSLQSGQYSELGPVKCFHISVIHNPKGRNGAIKVSLLSTSPPKTSQKTTDFLFWIETAWNITCVHCSHNIRVKPSPSKNTKNITDRR